MESRDQTQDVKLTIVCLYSLSHSLALNAILGSILSREMKLNMVDLKYNFVAVVAKQ